MWGGGGGGDKGQRTRPVASQNRTKACGFAIFSRLRRFCEPLPIQLCPGLLNRACGVPPSSPDFGPEGGGVFLDIASNAERCTTIDPGGAVPYRRRGPTIVDTWQVAQADKRPHIITMPNITCRRPNMFGLSSRVVRPN